MKLKVRRLDISLTMKSQLWLVVNGWKKHKMIGLYGHTIQSIWVWTGSIWRGRLVRHLICKPQNIKMWGKYPPWKTKKVKTGI